MRRRRGQPVGRLAFGLWTVLHRALGVAMALTIAAAAGSAALAWFLARHPVEVPWLAQRLEVQANALLGPGAVSIRSTEIAWDGFRKGLGSPIVVRLDGIRLRTDAGDDHAAIPRAELTFALLPLLHGRLEPRAVEVEAPRITATRRADGTLGFALGGSKTEIAATTPHALLSALSRSQRDQGQTGVAILRELRRIRVLDASISVDDRRLRMAWRGSQLTLDLAREPDGRIDGHATGQVAVGDARAKLTVAGTPAQRQISLHAAFSPIATAALIAAAPPLAGLAGLDAPLGGTIDLTLSPALTLQQASLALRADAGTLHLGAAPLPLLGGTLLAEATPEQIAITRMAVKLQAGAPAGPVSLLAHGTVHRSVNDVNADLALDLDRLPFAALPALWPLGLAKDARVWVTQNITEGTARSGHLDLRLTADPTLSRISVTGASGSLAADDVTVRWFGQVAPIMHAQAGLRIVDPDRLEINATSGQLVPDAPRAGPLAVRAARVSITGLMQKDQSAKIDGRITGAVPDALALLRDRRLHLLSDHPINLQETEGTVDTTLSVRIPLTDKLTMDDVPISAKARLSDVHLTDVAVGWDLDGASLGLTVTPDQLVADGSGLLAGIPVQLGAKMDFRAGSPGQMLQEMTVTGRPDLSALAAAGLDTEGLVSGAVPLSATYTERRGGGAGEVAVHTDLTEAALAVSALGWRKPPGVQAEAGARLRLDRDRLVAIDGIEAAGSGLAVQGQASFAGGAFASLTLDRVVLGRSEARATLRFAPNGGAVAASVSGRVLDLSQRFGQSTGTAQPPKAAQRGRPWTVDARFDSILLAHGRALSGVSMHAVNDGLLLREATLRGATGQHEIVQLSIHSQPDGRRVSAEAANAGALFQALGLPGVIGGKLTLQGGWDGWQPDSPLIGTVKVADFRVREAPTLGKLLQAVTLYGLAQALAGPGVGFDHLTAPFRYRVRHAADQRRTCLQQLAGHHSGGPCQPRYGPVGHRRDRRAAIRLQHDARACSGAGTALQPGTQRWLDRRALSRAWRVARPDGLGQSVFRADAGRASRSVRSLAGTETLDHRASRKQGPRPCAFPSMKKWFGPTGSIPTGT